MEESEDVGQKRAADERQAASEQIWLRTGAPAGHGQVLEFRHLVFHHFHPHRRRVAVRVRHAVRRAEA